MNEIKRSLTRKFGPLPVWAWAAITGAAIYIYRTRQSLAAGTTTSSTTGTADAGAGTTPQPITTLQPGESAYDPNTGALLGTAQSAPLTPTPLDPIPLAPGEQIYDPNTHTLVGNPQAATTTAAAASPKAQTNLSRAEVRASRGQGGANTIKTLLRAGFSRGQISHAMKTKSPLGTPKGKRGTKATRSQPNPARQPTHGKTRARSSAVTRDVARSVGRQGASSGRTRGAATPATPVGRTRARPLSGVATRQRPAPPRMVNHAAQKVETHPARQPATAKKRKR